MSKTIVAIDVGYGNTKVCWQRNGEARKQFIFTSQVQTINEPVETIPGMAAPDRVQVNLHDKYFLVGPDVAGYGSTQLNSDYANSDGYKALVIGALHYVMKTEAIPLHEIDCLVLGLPVSEYKDKKRVLENRFTGRFSVPTIRGLSHLGESISVHIKKVAVIPQPIGSLYHFVIKSDDPTNLSKKNLVIDPGYLTVDWLLSEGLKPKLEHSGAFNGGVSAILKEVVKAYKNKTKMNISLHDADKALQTGTINLYGEPTDFEPYQKIAHQKAKELVSVLMGEIDGSNKTGANWDNIVITGGGAPYFAKAMSEVFKGKFHVMDHPVMGNVQGFCEYGQHLMDQ